MHEDWTADKVIELLGKQPVVARARFSTSESMAVVDIYHLRKHPYPSALIADLESNGWAFGYSHAGLPEYLAGYFYEHHDISSEMHQKTSDLLRSHFASGGRVEDMPPEPPPEAPKEPEPQPEPVAPIAMFNGVYTADTWPPDHMFTKHLLAWRRKEQNRRYRRPLSIGDLVSVNGCLGSACGKLFAIDYDRNLAKIDWDHELDGGKYVFGRLPPWCDARDLTLASPYLVRLSKWGEPADACDGQPGASK